MSGLYSMGVASRLKKTLKNFAFFWLLLTRRLKYRNNFNFSLAELMVDFAIKPKSILQVGASSGQEASLLLERCEGLVYFLEPLSREFLLLQQNVRNERAILMNVAAGNSKGLIEMNLANNDGQSSSILRPLKHLEFAPQVKFEGTEEVEMIKIDDIFHEHVPDFWILDTQGYELEVLQGGKNSLKKANYLLCEVHWEQTYEGCTQIDELDKFLFSEGFRRVATHRFDIWGDALYERFRNRVG